MAIFHLSSKVIASSRSVVGCAAYRAGSRLVEMSSDGDFIKVHDYSRRKGIVFSDIISPHGLKFDREYLWNLVSNYEALIRKDSQLSREIDLALPIELSLEENVDLLLRFVNECIVSQGMIADVNVHYDNPNNPHAHILMTLRELVKSQDLEGFSKMMHLSNAKASKIFDLYKDSEIDHKFGIKNSSWNKVSMLNHFRESWANFVNHELEVRGFDSRITQLSFKDLGIGVVPSVHEGPGGYITNSKVKAINSDIFKENIDRVRSNPELVIDLLKFTKQKFTAEDIANKLSYFLFSGNIPILDENLSKEYIKCLDSILNSDRLTVVTNRDLNGKTVYTTNDLLELETRFVNVVSELNSSSCHAIDIEDSSRYINDKSDVKLSDQQISAVNYILRGSEISIVEGLPGSGKSTIMNPVRKIYQELGYRVLGATTSAAAARNLFESSGIESKTIAKLIHQLNGGYFEFSKNDVLVIDEMSMVDLRNFEALLSRVKDSGSKVILLGDTNQFSAINFKGAATKAVELVGSFKLDEVRRQRKQANVTKLLSEHRITEAFDLLKDSFRSANGIDLLRKKLVNDYTSEYVSIAKETGKSDLAVTKTSVVLGYTNSEIEELNKQIRTKLKLSGIVGQSEHEYKFFGKKMFLSKGDQIVFNRNDYKLGVINGDVGTVSKVAKDSLTVLVRGKVIDVDTNFYTDIKLGYALTAHKSQGSTYDYVRVIYSNAVKYEAFNVMATRHKENLKIYYCSEMYRNHQAIIKNVSMKESLMFASDIMSNAVKLTPEASVIADYVKNMNDLSVRKEQALKIWNNFELYKELLASTKISRDLVGFHAGIIKFNKSDELIMRDLRIVKTHVVDLEEKISDLEKQLELLNLRKDTLEYSSNIALPYLVSKIYKEDFATITQNFLKMYDKFQDRVATVINEKPTSIGTLKGIGISNYLGFTSSRKDAIELSNNIGTQLHEATFSFKSKVIIESEIENTAKDLKLNRSELESLKQEFLKTKQNQNANEIQIQALKQDVKQSSIKNTYEILQSKLTTCDYKNIFEKYAKILVDDKNSKIVIRNNQMSCGSLNMNLNNGLWIRFSNNTSGNVFSFIENAEAVSKVQALQIISDIANISVNDTSVLNNDDINHRLLNKDNTNYLALKNQKLNIKDIPWFKDKIETIHEYKNELGDITGYTARIVDESRNKKVIPLVYCVDQQNNKARWMIKSFDKTALYGVDRLNNDKDILIVEGERTADVAQELFPEYSVISFVGGARNAKNISFDKYKHLLLDSNLEHKNITIWPDNDEVGKNAATQLKNNLKAINHDSFIVDVEKLKLPNKWDLADGLNANNERFFKTFKLEQNLDSVEQRNDQKLITWDELKKIARLNLEVMTNDKSDNKITDEYKSKLDHEIEVIEKTNFQEDFVIAHSISSFCKLNDIKYHLRGSANSSLFAHLIDIHKIDPVEHGLLFERFLSYSENKSSKSIPDFDFDVDNSKRQTVVDHMFNSFKAVKMSILTNDEYKLHPSGIGIIPDNLTNDPRLEVDKNKMLLIDYKQASKIGVKKVDILSSLELTKIAKVEKAHGIDLDKILDKTNYQDRKTFDLINSAKTENVFQLGSKFAMKVCKSSKIEKFDDVTSLISNIRPGVNKNFKVIDPMNVLNGDKLNYQEQVMQMLNKYFKIDKDQTNDVRKTLEKASSGENESKEKLSLDKQKYIESAYEVGINKRQANSIINSLEKFAGTSYNKAHAVAYAKITIKSAYIKAHELDLHQSFNKGVYLSNHEKATCVRRVLDLHKTEREIKVYEEKEIIEKNIRFKLEDLSQKINDQVIKQRIIDRAFDLALLHQKFDDKNLRKFIKRSEFEISSEHHFEDTSSNHKLLNETAGRIYQDGLSNSVSIPKHEIYKHIEKIENDKLNQIDKDIIKDDLNKQMFLKSLYQLNFNRKVNEVDMAHNTQKAEYKKEQAHKILSNHDKKMHSGELKHNDHVNENQYNQINHHQNKRNEEHEIHKILHSIINKQIRSQIDAQNKIIHLQKQINHGIDI